MSFFSKVSKGITKAVRKIPQETRNFSNSIVRTGSAIGAAPFQVVGGVATGAIQGIAPALSAATGVLQANPALAGVLGGAIGMPGLGSMFGGGAADPGMGGGGFAMPEQPKASVPIWLWMAGGLAALLAVVLLLRKKG